MTGVGISVDAIVNLHAPGKGIWLLQEVAVRLHTDVNLEVLRVPY